jgi:hypothetical protein
MARLSTVRIRLTPELRRVVDDEVTRLKSLGAKVRVTREHAILSLIRRHVRNLQPDEVKGLYNGFLEEAARLKLHGNSRRDLGEIGPARQAFLRAAAFELLALSSIEDPPDNAIIQHLAEVVELAKDGTGYKALPDARPSTRLMTTAGSA